MDGGTGDDIGALPSEGTLTMNDSSSVSGNQALNSGGGLWNLEGNVIMNGSSSVSGNTGGGIMNTGTLAMSGQSSVNENTDFGIASGGTLTMSDSSSVTGNTADSYEGGGIRAGFGSVTLMDSASVTGNSAPTGGGIYVVEGTVGACDSTSVDEWVGTVEPNDPNDFLDSDVPLMSGGTGGCS